MALKHNKKRNVGLLREFFIQYLAESTINKKPENAERAKNIWNKYFAKGTELNKEYSLFRNIFETKLTNKEFGIEFIKNAKKVSKTFNIEKLNNEKTFLVREINNTLKESFFDRNIKNYSDYASIQICLDHWSNKNLNESIFNPAIIELEDKMLNFITTSKQVVINKETIKEDIKIDKLALKIMIEKFNTKILSTLTPSQQKLIKLYSFSNNENELVNEINSIQTNTLVIINKELNENKNLPSIQKQKFESIKTLLEENKITNINEVNDDSIAFYMSVSKLYDEYTGD